MAKPAKIKKDQDAAPAKKGSKKAVAKGKDAAVKGKGAKEEPKGFKARMAKAQSAKQSKPAQFLREVKVEMGKVTWPGREELIQSTLVVLLAVVVAGTFIAILDLVFSRLIGLIS
jgi:preprotein translocase subunit SecE